MQALDSKHVWQLQMYVHVQTICKSKTGYIGNHETAAKHDVEDDNDHKAMQEGSAHQVGHRWLELLRNNIQKLFQESLILRDGAEHYMACTCSNRLSHNLQMCSDIACKSQRLAWTSHASATSVEN